jgi:LuxR family maltose regulon positive regulatory protein
MLINQTPSDNVTHTEAKLLNMFADFLRERVKPAPPQVDDSASEVNESLSRREIEVLRLIEAGLTNREIAQRIVVEPGTVKRHVHNILGKLNARNRTEAVAKARELL